LTFGPAQGLVDGVTHSTSPIDAFSSHPQILMFAGDLPLGLQPVEITGEVKKCPPVELRESPYPLVMTNSLLLKMTQSK
jgi:hypothetical protein